MGIEPHVIGLGSRRSTIELHPHLHVLLYHDGLEMSRVTNLACHETYVKTLLRLPLFQENRSFSVNFSVALVKRRENLPKQYCQRGRDSLYRLYHGQNFFYST